MKLGPMVPRDLAESAGSDYVVATTRSVPSIA